LPDPASGAFAFCKGFGKKTRGATAPHISVTTERGSPAPVLCFLVGLDLERVPLTSFSALLSKKIDWRPPGKRKLGKYHEHHESEHQKEHRNVLPDVGAMKATFSGYGASTSLLVL
jgi:hypothetical protein